MRGAAFSPRSERGRSKSLIEGSSQLDLAWRRSERVSMVPGYPIPRGLPGEARDLSLLAGHRVVPLRHALLGGCDGICCATMNEPASPDPQPYTLVVTSPCCRTA